MVEFKLPDVGEGMHEGEITKWLIKEGDFVKQDQQVVEVQTDKVNTELTSPSTGRVHKIYFKEGDVVEVGTTIFTIIEEEGDSEASNNISNSTTSENMSRITSFVSTIQKEGTFRRDLATPYVRQKAREMSVDLKEVAGTGPAGRITEEDLLTYSKVNVNENAESQNDNVRANSIKDHVPSEPNVEERVQLTGIRKSIAKQMTKSVSAIPHVTHVDDLHIGPLKEFRKDMKSFAEQKGIKLTFLPFFIKAIVIALKEFPYLNASLDEDKNEIVLKKYYHIGIATNTNKGLVVPVIKNADIKSIFQLADEIRELADQAREGKLSLEHTTGSTFTISNVGPIGGLHATPIINHPEVAILALHKMEPRMVVRDWEGVIRLMMNMSLSFDHRIIDGVTAVQFTNRLKEMLEEPKRLFMEMT
ncbi:2-oxo acid dehydrogenase subunit E2 [Bacillus shivajii]|uniref:dihydrolipoamide acetyltransferase family protein n=1 Tax=Bacillus shivajii TaxID=1983719 RepID=UPI001CFB844C|nr:dihydrolipoamide acetyltransferase family protein [Bacillus shivajii]UCZ54471.1 2-oxo acid dehydrogenase subunit E2 [Bacillus shivajii]